MIRNPEGYTFIELMIVITIIGILTTIAIPQYDNYVVQSQVSKGMSLARSTRIPIATYYANKGRFPRSNQSAGLESPTSIQGKYVSAVKIQHNKKVRIEFGGFKKQNSQVSTVIRKRAILFSPYTLKGGDIAFTCQPALIRHKRNPSVQSQNSATRNHFLKAVQTKPYLHKGNPAGQRKSKNKKQSIPQRYLPTSCS